MKATIRFTIGDILFLLTMTFVMAFPNPSRMKALVVILFFSYTTFLTLFKKQKNTWHYIWAAGFFLYCKLSDIWSVAPSAAEDVISNVMWAMMLSVATANYVIMYRLSAVDLAKRMVVIGLIFAVDIILNGTYVEDGRYTVVINGYQINENSFSQIASCIGCYLLYWSKKRHWKKPFLNICVFGCAVIILMSGSRKGLLTLALFLAAFVMYEYPPRNLRKSVLRTIGVLLLVVTLYICVMNVDFLYSTVGNRIESLFAFLDGSKRADRSANTRWGMILAGLELFKEKPLLGYGLNTFKVITYYGTYSHNNYVELLANLGICGFLIYYIPLVVSARTAVKFWKNYSSGAIVPTVILLNFFFNEFMSVSYFSTIAHVHLGLALGLCSNHSQRKENNISS